MLFKKLFSTTLALGLMATAFAADKTAKKDAATIMKVDTSATQLKWVGKKVLGAHEGNISLKSGELKVNNSNIVGGNFVVDMNTMTCTDIPAKEEANAKLLGHLKSEDFFGTDKFPTANFQIESVTAKADKDGNTHEIAGSLTIKGVTNKVTFPAKVETKTDSVTANGTMVVNRTQYGIKYGSKDFFKSIGDKAIDNNFTVNVNLSAKK